MKLKKFRKNGKQKGIAIGCVIALLITIAGVNLYRTFAIYKEEKTFNVLRGVVPDFTKNKGTPYNEQLNGADPVVKGDLVAVIVDPETGEVTKADTNAEWYNYEKKQWANAIIPTSSAKSTVKGYSAGHVIEENQIESYFVWIPKYSYQIQTTGTSSSSKVKSFEIKFGTENTDDNNENECTTPDAATASGNKGTCEEDDYMTHPAFLAFGGNGFWVGKFETGEKDASSAGATERTTYNDSDLSKIVIKPNQYSWTNTYIATTYQLAYNYQRELDSHMMKNTEWGAVAYLTQSIYGRCTKGDEGTTCEEVTLNNNSNKVTGYTGTETSYPSSKEASTTGNNTGIYDMSGGAPESVMAIVFDSDGNPIVGDVEGSIENEYGLIYRRPKNESGFSGYMYVRTEKEREQGIPYFMYRKVSGSPIPEDSKYYDRYNYVQSGTYVPTILGDATAETHNWYNNGYDVPNFPNSGKSSCYVDYTPRSCAKPWFVRGGMTSSNGLVGGIFSSDEASYSYGASHMVLAI